MIAISATWASIGPISTTSSTRWSGNGARAESDDLQFSLARAANGAGRTRSLQPCGDSEMGGEQPTRNGLPGGRPGRGIAPEGDLLLHQFAPDRCALAASSTASIANHIS